jgi:lipopolysaccharide export system protein LptA
MMKPIKLAILACLAAMGTAEAAVKPGPSPTPAASPSPDAGLFPGGNSKDPIFIEADRLFYSDKDAKAIYTGNVVLIQGPTKLTCAVMTLYIDKGSATPTPSASAAPVPKPTPTTTPAAAASSGSSSQVKHMDCTGPVTVLSKTQTATGDNAVYDKPKNTVWLFGHVTLSDGPNVTKGDKLTYDLATGHAIVEMNPSQGKARVQSQFIPNSSDNSSPTPAPSPSPVKP